MDRANLSRGDVVVGRETWGARTFRGWLARVVEDTGERVAVHLAEGTRFEGTWRA